MKILVERTGLYVVVKGKTIELPLGEVELDTKQAESFLSRKLVTKAGKKKSANLVEDKKEESKKEEGK